MGAFDVVVAHAVLGGDEQAEYRPTQGEAGGSAGKSSHHIRAAQRVVEMDYPRVEVVAQALGC